MAFIMEIRQRTRLPTPMESESKISIDSSTTRIINIRHVKLHYGDFDIAKYVRSDNPADLTVSVEQQYAVSKTGKGLGILTSVIFNHPESNESIIEYTGEIIYELDYFDKIVTREGEKDVVEIGVLKFMYLITLATTRGLLYERLANSPYSKVVLPVLDLEHAYK